MRRLSAKDVKYEAPRLQTYGKLQALTKGTGGTLPDTDQQPTKGNETPTL
jgi:hypothetical protein